ncbi:hypothetical protein GGR52DRAFT_138564 [Hypoxylon sp. FL1284]|nr:hypothetical protein GGR52DRAFT_138564 [Hypoxylon sp. FL1284]
MCLGRWLPTKPCHVGEIVGRDRTGKATQGCVRSGRVTSSSYWRRQASGRAELTVRRKLALRDLTRPLAVPLPSPFSSSPEVVVLSDTVVLTFFSSSPPSPFFWPSDATLVVAVTAAVVPASGSAGSLVAETVRVTRMPPCGAAARSSCMRLRYADQPPAWTRVDWARTVRLAASHTRFGDIVALVCGSCCETAEARSLPLPEPESLLGPWVLMVGWLTR